jgi:hypothetical protein
MALRGHNPTAIAAEPTVRFLITACKPCRLAFPAAWVRGILTPEEAGSEQAVLSAGATYQFTDLADRLRLPPSLDPAGMRVILYGNGTCARAFTVDEVIELIDTDPRHVRRLPAQFRNAERTRLSGFLLYANTMALIVNPLWLLETDATMDAFQSWSVAQQGVAGERSRDIAITIPMESRLST